MKDIYTKISLLLYIFINGLFVYKYGSRQGFIEPLVLILGYIATFFGVVLLFFKGYFEFLNSKKIWSQLFPVIIVLFALVFFMIIQMTDENALITDRWSALEITVEGIIKGVYPYDRPDHVGNLSSNFPGLGYLALPFYLLGDVGYLQVFTFVVFGLYLNYRLRVVKNKYFLLFLYLFSPALWWELLAKSDLLSNFFLLVICIEWLFQKRKTNFFSRPVLIGGLLAFFILTRGVVLIPIIIFFLKDFIQTETRNKVISLFTGVLFVGLLCLPIMLSAINIEAIVANNPWNLQTNKAPWYAYVLLIAPVIVAFSNKNDALGYWYSGVIVFLIPFFGLINVCIVQGWRMMLFEHKFDVSYLSMTFPFMFVYLKHYLENKNVV